jgi:8-amino-7-oxononanoate synthase
VDALAHYSHLLTQREADSRRRSLREILPADGAIINVNGKPLVDFASNDYLGLARNPLLVERAIEFTRKFGAGSTASRLLSGNIAPFERIERKLASLKGTEAALLLPTGFQANTTVIPALADSARTQVLCDRLCHQSLLSGAQLSAGKWTRFAHNDVAALEQRIEAAPDAERRLVVTESVFSMDGDAAPLDELITSATKYGAILYVDEAHATGVQGPHGMGLTAARATDGVALISMGTFGKALGSFGAYIACTREMRDYLINYCAGVIYTTALPPSVLGAIDAALDIIPTMERQRAMLLSDAERLRTKLRAMGFDCGASTSQIIPIIVGSDANAVSLAKHLEAGGFFAPAIRPPTVPEGSARVRLSLTALHTREQLERLCLLMRDWREN